MELEKNNQLPFLDVMPETRRGYSVDYVSNRGNPGSTILRELTRKFHAIFISRPREGFQACLDRACPRLQLASRSPFSRKGRTISCPKVLSKRIESHWGTADSAGMPCFYATPSIDLDYKHKSRWACRSQPLKPPARLVVYS